MSTSSVNYAFSPAYASKKLSPLRKRPVAQRVRGENDDSRSRCGRTTRGRPCYDPAATLGDLREAVTTSMREVDRGGACSVVPPDHKGT